MVPSPTQEAGRCSRFYRSAIQAYSGPFLFFKELFGLTSAASSHIHLTDGGHIEDLGLYELLHRRCKYVILSDSSSEDEGPLNYRFNRLATATRLARIHQGVEIVLDLSAIRPDAAGNTRRHYTVGLIYYPARPALGLPQETGYLLYIKQCMTGMERLVDVTNQRHNNSRFPNDPTSNQFFSEDQFEAYRALGHHIMRGICADAQRNMTPPPPSSSSNGPHPQRYVMSRLMRPCILGSKRCCSAAGMMGMSC